MASESIAVSTFGLMGYWLTARAQGILLLNISANQPASHARHEQNMVACLHIVHPHFGCHALSPRRRDTDSQFIKLVTVGKVQCKFQETDMSCLHDRTKTSCANFISLTLRTHSFYFKMPWSYHYMYCYGAGKNRAGGERESLHERPMKIVSHPLSNYLATAAWSVKI